MNAIASLVVCLMKFSSIIIPVPFLFPVLFEVFFPLSVYFVNNKQEEIISEQAIKIEMLQEELLFKKQELLVAKIERAVRQDIIADCNSKPVNIDYAGKLSRTVQNAVSKELGRYFDKENADIFDDRITYLANNIVELEDMFYRLEDAVWEYSDDSSQDHDATSMIATELSCPREHVSGKHLMQLSDNYSPSVINLGIDELFQNIDIVPEPFKEVEDGTLLYGQSPLVASLSREEIKAIEKMKSKIKE